MSILPGRALALAACLVLAPLAGATDDCCFDWNNLDAGVGDVPAGSPTLPPSPSRPGAPFGWAQCTGAVENGPGLTNCFSRKNRQGFIPGYNCVIGSAAPNGTLPIPNIPWGAGFQCVSRADDAQNISLQFINMITEPLGQEGLVIFEEKRKVLSSLGDWGGWVLALLFCAGGAWMLRRRAPALQRVA